MLLDTQSFLWFINGDARLSNKVRTLIEDITSTRFLSVVSIWEIAIKVSIGKLDLELPYATLVPQQLNRNRIALLGITIEHAAVVANLPFHHKDPFDRMIIAQSIVEQIPIISVDSAFDAYNVTRLW